MNRLGACCRRLRTFSSPYEQLARLDKPTGTMLLYLPCSWSILMAANQANVDPGVTIKSLALFGAGAFIMRGAGCTINDLWDRDLDKYVQRTRDRPLARGAISVRQAVQFLGVQLMAGLGVLTQMNWTSIGLGASSLLLVGAYPLMKRITNYPQLVLGLTFNWGALLGFTALLETLPLAQAVPLYSAGISWTLIYDTLYAHQDKQDDVLIGVRSTALTFGDQTKPILTKMAGFSGIGLAAAGLASGMGPAYFVGSAAAVANMLRVTWRTDLHDPRSCQRAFKSSVWAGYFVSLGLAADYIYNRYHQDARKIDK